MIRRQLISTLTATRIPYATLFRSTGKARGGRAARRGAAQPAPPERGGKGAHGDRRRPCRSARRPPARRRDGAPAGELSAALSRHGLGGRDDRQPAGHPRPTRRPARTQGRGARQVVRARKSAGSGKSVSVRLDLGGSRFFTKKQRHITLT